MTLFRWRTAASWWWRSIVHREAMERELDEEFSFHLEQAIAHHVAEGIPPEQAALLAQREMMPLQRFRESCHDSWLVSVVDGLRTDVAHAWRLFCRSPGSSSIIVITLAFAIGLNTVVFSLFDAVLLQQLPYRDPQQLVAIWDHHAKESGLDKVFASHADFTVWSHASSVEQLALATWAVDGYLLTGSGPAREVMAEPVSAGFFDLLGVPAARGRTFEADDMMRGCSVVLSDRFWRSQLHAQESAVGDRLTLNQRSCTILGIMPRGFFFYPAAADLWTLLTPDFQPSPSQLPIGIFGRLRPGASLQDAETELGAIHAALHAQDGLERDIAPIVSELRAELTWLTDRTLRRTLYVLLAAVSMVLLLACANVASLLVGQLIGRHRELEVRLALGATRGRLARQLLTESLMFAVAGALVGVFVAAAGQQLLDAVQLPPGVEPRINGNLLMFTIVSVLMTAICCGLAPAWTLGDRIESKQFQGVTPRRRRWMQWLMIAELTLSFVLVSAAILFTRSVIRMESTDLGFRSSDLLTTSIRLPADEFTDPQRRSTVSNQLLADIAHLPGVRGVASTTTLPPVAVGTLAIERRGSSPTFDSHDVAQQLVSPDYFAVLGMPLERGRGFADSDTRGQPMVAVVNQALAARYFADRDPLGQQIRVASVAGNAPWLTIVGVVANDRRTSIYQQMRWIESPAIFRPIAQNPPLAFGLAIGTTGDNLPVGAEVGEAIAAVNSRIPIAEVVSMESRLDRVLGFPRFRAQIVRIFAAFAIAVSSLGLFGLLTQLTATRAREIAIRSALGARRRSLVRSIVAPTTWPVGVGLAVGAVATLVTQPAMATLLSDLPPTDVVTLGTTTVTLSLVAIAAMTWPVWRALRHDSATLFRQE